ncbi:MAG: YfhO family protein, partial [Thermoanaerobaculia bacterium]
IGVVFGLCVWLARRAGVALPRRIALFFYLLTLLFFWKPLTGPYINFPIDVLPSIPPWQHLTEYRHQYTPELNDIPMQIVPWAHAVREQWRSFTPPLWNRYSESGYPLHGNGQSSALSLLRIVTLPLPIGRAMAAEAALKVLIALVFTYLYCRRRYSMLASSVAAVSFGYCGFMIGWLHFPLVTTACLAPAVLYCIDVLAERRTFGRMAFTVFVLTQLLFAGHPETVAHLAWLAAVYVLWIVFVERVTADRARFFRTLATTVVIATLLSMPYLLPLTETMLRSKRIAELKERPYAANALPNTDRYSALVSLQPHFFGQVPLERPWGPSDTEPLAGFPGVFGWAAWFACAVHVVWRRQWRSRELFFVLATIFTVGVIYSWPGIGELFHFIIPIGAHARMRLLFAFLAALQTAAAIDYTRRVPLLLGILGVAGLLFLILREVPVHYAYRYDTAVLAMLPSLLVLAMATMVAVTKRELAVLALLAAVIIEMFAIGRNRPTPLPERMLYPKTPVIAKLQELFGKLPPNDPYRFVGISAQLFPNTSAMYGIEDIRAHDPMSNARYVAFLKLTADYEPWNYFAFIHDANKPVFDFLNVRYVLVEPWIELHDPSRYKVVYDGRDGRIFENTRAMPRFYPVRNVLLEHRPEIFYPMMRQAKDWRFTAYLDDLKLETEQQRADFFNARPADAPDAKTIITRAKPT